MLLKWRLQEGQDFIHNLKIRANRFHTYYGDFAFPSLNLIIEVDGSYWHKDSNYDELRDKRLLKAGWKVERISDLDLFHNLDKTRRHILKLVSSLRRSSV